jgi:hypothetical protein
MFAIYCVSLTDNFGRSTHNVEFDDRNGGSAIKYHGSAVKADSRRMMRKRSQNFVASAAG